MKHRKGLLGLIGLAVLTLSTTGGVNAQERRTFFSLENPGLTADGISEEAHATGKVYSCRGPVTRVMDVGYEGVKTTSFNWSNTTGGGESGRFDKTPVLSTRVTLAAGSCLDAHFSAIVGSRQAYGTGVSSITMFQVTLTPVAGGPPQHMVGHYETPYGLYGPAVAHEAERDVDMYASNFFQRVGSGSEDVPPGTYRVDVWWAGGPIGGGGAIGAGFVLKLYMR